MEVCRGSIQVVAVYCIAFPKTPPPLHEVHCRPLRGRYGSLVFSDINPENGRASSTRAITGRKLIHFDAESGLLAGVVSRVFL